MHVCALTHTAQTPMHALHTAHMCTYAHTQCMHTHRAQPHTSAHMRAHSTNTGEHTAHRNTQSICTHREHSCTHVHTAHTYRANPHTCAHMHTAHVSTHVCTHTHAHMSTRVHVHTHTEYTHRRVHTQHTQARCRFTGDFLPSADGRLRWDLVQHVPRAPSLCVPHCSTLTPAPVCPRHGLNLLSGVPLNTNIPSHPCQIVWPETCQNVLPACPRPIAYPESRVTFTPFLTFCLSRRSAPQSPRASRSVLLLL